jgi:hypothetical protein
MILYDRTMKLKKITLSINNFLYAIGNSCEVWSRAALPDSPLNERASRDILCDQTPGTQLGQCQVRIKLVPHLAPSACDCFSES